MKYGTVYDTSLGKHQVTSTIVRAITESCIKEDIHQKDYSVALNTAGFSLALNVEPIIIAGYYGSEGNIPSFNHPLFMTYSGTDYICVDVRNFVRPQQSSPISNAYQLRDEDEFNLIRLRLATQIIWLTSNPDVLRNVHVLPAKVYCEWISKTVCNRFGMGALESYIIEIIACVFYFSMFSEGRGFDEDQLVSLAGKVMRVVGGNHETIFEKINELPPMMGIVDLALAIAKFTPNIRVENLDGAGLATMLATSWYGHASREVMPAAVEHPPTWISIVYAALHERRFRNSGIANITKKYEKNKGGDDFIRSLKSLIKSKVEVNE